MTTPAPLVAKAVPDDVDDARTLTGDCARLMLNVIHRPTGFGYPA